ncbi:MAG: 1-deoxy-D-xylulose-5-phosphate synthase [Alphaproteobacteria bacterium MarineAlpha2_Bin1]|nr:MAG: 1-deoxy-D-xylulose-5-phosphate synthase [Alphaproteobacteria bacterium MarineAlpha2_Bin1]
MRKTCLDMVYELAKTDDRIVFIGSDLGAGTLSEMQKNMPERFFMEGVSEANIIGMAAGLAMDGFIPYVNTISTFITRRCYEQIAIDLCLHNLPVKLIANGGGLVYAPLGPTHLAIEDIAIMRSLPNMNIVSPSDAEEMIRFMKQSKEIKGPVYIRLAKGGDEIVSNPKNGFKFGESILMKDVGEVLIVSSGITTKEAIYASEELSKEGIKAGVLHMHTIKPFDYKSIIKYSQKVKLIISVEEHIKNNGLGSAIGDVLNDTCYPKMPKLIKLGIPDQFPDKYGTQEELLKYYSLDSKSIYHSVMDFLKSTGLRAA